MLRLSHGSNPAFYKDAPHPVGRIKDTVPTECFRIYTSGTLKEIGFRPSATDCGVCEETKIPQVPRWYFLWLRSRFPHIYIRD
jgi:hypothetical protein